MFDLDCVAQLQQHALFFDKDNDGVIWPPDIFYWFHQIRFNIFLCPPSMVVIYSGCRYLLVSHTLLMLSLSSINPEREAM